MLRARVDGLLARCGFASSGVFVMDASRRSAHGNAYFTGFGRHKRIVLFDTLVECLEPPEVEAVLAHELGHFRLGHSWQRLALSAVAALGACAALGRLAAVPTFYSALGVPTPTAEAALLLFVLVGPVAAYFLGPLLAVWSRRQELAADAFAARHADAAALASALVTLQRDNAATLTPDRIHSAFYDSHPPLQARVAKLLETASP